MQTLNELLRRVCPIRCRVRRRALEGLGATALLCLVAAAFGAESTGTVGGPEFGFLRVRVPVVENEGVARLEVIRLEDANEPITVDFLTEALTATPETDYAPVTGRITFQPGEHAKLIEIPILNDGFTEREEAFRVVLTHASQGGISAQSGAATVTIGDNDPGLRFDSSMYDVEEGDGEVVLNVLRGADVSGAISIDYSLEPVTATPEADYAAVTGRLVFGPDDLVQALRIPIIRDALKERSETFRVALSGPSQGASLGSPAVTTVRILDDDSGFRFAQSTRSVAESEGTVFLAVSRGTDLPGEIAVDYATEPISATPDLDYTPVQGRLTFPAAVLRQEIEIPILQDSLNEPAEIFRVVLSNPTAGVGLGTPSAVTIRIEPNARGFAFESTAYSFSENQGKAIFLVARGTDPVGESSVDYSVETVSATEGLDYLAVGGTLVFREGELWGVIEVPILNDAIKEPIETFRVKLSNPGLGSTIGSPSIATASIVDNDLGFRFFSTGFAASEDGGEVVLLVDRGADAIGEVSVDFVVEPLTATPGVDYTAVSGRLTFREGVTYQEIRVPIVNDVLIEAPETFRVILRNPGADASLGSPTTARVTIQDNDLGFVLECPPFSPNCPSPWENGGAVQIDVVIVGDFKLTDSASVEVVTEPVDAAADVDYESVRETVTFAPGETRKTVTIPLINDSHVDPAESFQVVLRNPVGLPMQSARSLALTIQDNERGYWIEPTANGDPLLVSENSGEVLLNLRRDGDFAFGSSVGFRTSGSGEFENAAVPGQDFVAASGRVTFGPGETNQTIRVQLLDDDLIELRERFFIELSDPTAGVPSFDFGKVCWVEIVDNERNPLRVDPDFRPVVHYAPGQWDQSGTGLQALSDGRIVMPTPLWRLNGGDGVGLVRLLPDGRLDPGFEMARIPNLLVFAVQADGRVLVGGDVNLSVNGTRVGSLARLNAEGSLDSEFLDRLPRLGGVAVTALAAQPDRKILVATLVATVPNGVLVRLNSDGSLDGGFQLARVNGKVNRMVLDQVGRVWIWGGYDFTTVNGRPRPGLARFLPDGSLDETFLATWDSGTIERFELEAGGTALVRFKNSGPVLARLTEDGSIDPTFKAQPFSGLNFFAAVPTNKVLISTEPDFESGLVSRLNADGSPDESFLPGTYTLTFPTSGGWWGSFHTLTAEPTGNLLVSGDPLGVNGQGEPGPVRLLVEPPPSARIEVDASSARVIETNGTVSVKLVRTGNASAPVTVNWAPGGGTARPGVDYLTSNGSVTFAAGESEHTVSVSLLDNSEWDEDRDVRLRLTGPDGAPLPDVVFTIVNDDLGFVPNGFYATPDGRVLMRITGHRNGASVRVQRSSNLVDWEDWIYPGNESQFLDSDPPPSGIRSRFYRLVRD